MGEDKLNISKNLDEIKKLLNIDRADSDDLSESIFSYGKEIIIDDVKESYTFDELVDILINMYNKENNNKAAAIHMFGIKYGKYIIENNFRLQELIDKAKINETMSRELLKGINLYKSILSNEYNVRFYQNNNVHSSRESHVSYELISAEWGPRENPKHPLNSILYGPPGTGKTYSSIEYALSIIEDVDFDVNKTYDNNRDDVMNKYNKYVDSGRIVFVTFHQNYSYEDFIQGLRPDIKSDKLNFKNVDGIFKEISDRALTNNEDNFVIIIDEINRANISKVFGELITFIEDDKRLGELNASSVMLPSGDQFVIPNNLYIIGTMNSSDKSISLIDAALRRRFEFIEKRIQPKLIIDDKLRDIFVSLNKKLASDLDSTDLLIGHSYFMNKETRDLVDIFNKNIIPLLYEYFYDNRKKILNILKSIGIEAYANIEDDGLSRIKLVTK